MPARITGAVRFIKNTNPKPILEGKGALVYNLELHDLGVAGLPECVRLEHVGGVGDLDRAFFNTILENSKGESSRTPTENNKSAPRGCAFVIFVVQPI